VIILLFVVVAVAAPLIAPYGYNELNPADAYQGPSLKHLLGTDNLGRDLLSRVMYGARYSLGMAAVAEVLGLAVGLVLGCLAGYFGGWADTLIMRLMDIFQSIPSILLAVIISTVFGGTFLGTSIALCSMSLSSFARMSRAQLLKIRSEEYVEAAQAIDCSVPRQIFKHMLPNILSPLIVSLTMGAGNVITSAAMLSYIGLGIQPPNPEWGAMLSASKTYMRLYPHMMIVPGVCIAIVVLALNLVGDALRDAMDPKLKD
ncbi:MAG: ABC transporter permease, partial [Lachnospiraceae bacterium]|nr:ABC transporter permease [Lachnospiraceae bacterium]